MFKFLSFLVLLFASASLSLTPNAAYLQIIYPPKKKEERKEEIKFDVTVITKSTISFSF